MPEKVVTQVLCPGFGAQVLVPRFCAQVLVPRFCALKKQGDFGGKKIVKIPLVKMPEKVVTFK